MAFQILPNSFFLGIREGDCIRDLASGMSALHLVERSPKAGDVFALCVDEDSEPQQFISPRTNPSMSFETRLDELVKIFVEHKKRVATVGVALTVEELCPGGLDATDGIEIAKRLEQAGAAFIIARVARVIFQRSSGNAKHACVKNMRTKWLGWRRRCG